MAICKFKPFIAGTVVKGFFIVVAATAKTYSNAKLTLGICSSLLSFLFTGWLVFSGVTRQLEGIARAYASSEVTALLLFALQFGLLLAAVTAPFSFISGYLLEHKYGLSNQSLGKYFTEQVKGIAVGVVLGVPVLVVFYYSITRYPAGWWVVMGSFMFFFSVVLAQLFPVVILPLFYKITPITDEALSAMVKRLAGSAGFSVSSVNTFGMSEHTKKANAALVGLGSTKKVILGDTLISGFTLAEIESVLAHEFGHYALRHIPKNLVVGTVLSFAGFYTASVAYNSLLPMAGFAAPNTPAAMPLLLLIGSVMSLFTTPFSHWLSRRFEYQADEFSVKMTGGTDAFQSALRKLSMQNLADPDPPRFVEWYFYSHPSIAKRLRALATGK